MNQPCSIQCNIMSMQYYVNEMLCYVSAMLCQWNVMSMKWYQHLYVETKKIAQENEKNKFILGNIINDKNFTEKSTSIHHQIDIDLMLSANICQ